MSKKAKTTELPKGEYSQGKTASNPYGKNPSSQDEFIRPLLELPGNKTRKRAWK